jgi:hypothetical protein
MGGFADFLEAFNTVPPKVSAVLPALHRKVARMLCFDDTEVPEDEPAVVFSATPVSVLAKRRRGESKKYPTPFVETGLRRSKRSCVRQPGYRPFATRAHNVSTDESPPSSVRIVELPNDDQGQDGGSAKDARRDVVPETPIPLMQSVGSQLGIDPVKTSEEKLRAPLKPRRPRRFPMISDFIICNMCEQDYICSFWCVWPLNLYLAALLYVSLLLWTLSMLFILCKHYDLSLWYTWAWLFLAPVAVLIILF